MPALMVGDMQTGQGGLETQVKKERLNHLVILLVCEELNGYGASDIP
jgi:hypothetical protein